MAKWIDNNTLNIFRESLPVDERDDYAAWKKDYDYKNSPDGSNWELNRRLSSYKGKKRNNETVSLLKKAFKVYDLYVKLLGDSMSMDYARENINFCSEYVGNIHDFKYCVSDRVDVWFVGDKNLDDHLYNKLGEYPVYYCFSDSNNKNCGVLITIPYDNYNDVSKRVIDGIRKKVENTIYKDSGLKPFIQLEDGIAYYFDVTKDEVSNAEEVMHILYDAELGL